MVDAVTGIAELPELNDAIEKISTYRIEKCTAASRSVEWRSL